MLVDVYNLDGSKSEEKIDLRDEIFSIEPSDHAIYLDVKAYLANQRQGTHKSKERGEVAGGGKKPWRQKGRGGARAGTSRSPLWVGGGTIFGPRPRDYRQKINKKLKSLARKSALSYKAKSEQVFVVKDFNFDEPKTQKFVEILKSMNFENKKLLLLTKGKLENVYKSGRNIPKVYVLEAAKASTYELVNNQVLLIQQGALEDLYSSLNKIKEIA